MNTKWSWTSFSSVLGAVLSVLVLSGPVQAQEPAQVAGQVTDAAGEPIQSANVTIEGMQLGTTTNAEGRYLITVPASRVQGQEATIRAELIGRQSQTQTVTLSSGSAVVANFTLAEDPLRLEELIVTGAGTTQLRERLGVTINTVEAEELDRSQEPNLVQAMAGTAPNVEITSSGGDPGAGSYVRIRGANSLLGDGQPLFVVDGVPINNSSNFTDPSIDQRLGGTVETNRAFDLNPNDIADIQILKGPSAAAIYGSRAADGVILITTRKGQAGESRMSYQMEYSMDEINQMPDLQTTYGQGLSGTPGLSDLFGLPPDHPLTPVLNDPNQNVCDIVLGQSPDECQVAWGGTPISGPVYDHTQDVFEEGSRLEQFVTFSGGSETTDYYLSLGHMNHDGTVVGPQSYERTTVRLSGSHSFRDDLRLGANFQYTDSEGDLVQQGSNISGLLLAQLRTPPDFNNRPYIDPETGLHRSYRFQNPGLTDLAVSRGYDNPLWIANEIRNTTSVGRTFGNIDLNYTPTDWFQVNYTLGADYSADARLNLFPKSSSQFPDGKMIRTDLVDWSVDHNLVATMNHELNEDMSGTLALGQNLNHSEYTRYQVTGNQVIFGTDQLDYAVTRVPNEYRETVRTDGYFAQATVDMYDELFLTGAVRMDGSNTFGSDDNRFIYPKFSGAWTFTDYLSDSFDALSFGQLRAAYGVAGKQPVPFSSVTGFLTGTITDGWLNQGIETIYSGQEGVVSEFTQGNPDIDPERVTEFEIGGDLAFLDGRLSLGVTYYQQHTEDAILAVSIPPSTGYGARYENAGEFSNWGWETTLDAQVYESRDFAWDVGLQWAQNASCVEDLAGTETFTLTGFTGSISAAVAPERDDAGNITKCHPLNTFYGFDFVRFGRGSTVSGENIDQAYSGWAPGDVFIGADGFPRQDSQSRVVGDANPDWTGAVRTSVTLFNNLEISGLVDIRQGNEVWNGTRGALDFFGTSEGSERFHGAGEEVVMGEDMYADESVAGPGVGTPVKVDWIYHIIGIGSGFTGPFTPYLEDGSYLKLRHLTLRYTLSEMDWMDRLGFSDMTLGVSGRNLKTWTDYTGIDPETNLEGQTLGRGIDYFNNPQTRSFVFTVSLNR